jgi:hypothetical protein
MRRHTACCAADRRCDALASRPGCNTSRGTTLRQHKGTPYIPTEIHSAHPSCVTSTPAVNFFSCDSFFSFQFPILREVPTVRAPAFPAVAAITLAAALAFSSTVRAGDSAAVAEAGSWQSHEYTFQFLGFTSTYSCDGLAGKLRKLLLAAGARADVKSVPGACASAFGRPDKFARADLAFYTLTPADSGGGADKAVNGTWRAVTFANRAPSDLAIGDCELVEQFRTQVLPLFSTRNVANNTACIPHQDSGSVINLKFDSFAAIPAKKPAATAHNAS